MSADSLQRSVVLGHVGERSFGANHVFINAGFLHPHHPVGVLLFFLLGLFTAGVAGLLMALLRLLLLGLLGSVGKHDVWLIQMFLSV